MKLYVSSIVAGLFSLALSGCGGSATTGGLGAMPASRTVNPLANSVVVTAVQKGKPIAHLEVSLTRGTWPGGKLISKGATGMQGRVKLSGNWTAKDVICAGGKLYTRSGYSVRSKCEQPFPTALKLDF
jgi:hypothetical protein